MGKIITENVLNQLLETISKRKIHFGTRWAHTNKERGGKKGGGEVQGKKCTHVKFIISGKGKKKTRSKDKMEGARSHE